MTEPRPDDTDDRRPSEDPPGLDSEHHEVEMQLRRFGDIQRETLAEATAEETTEAEAAKIASWLPDSEAEADPQDRDDDAPPAIIHRPRFGLWAAVALLAVCGLGIAWQQGVFEAPGTDPGPVLGFAASLEVEPNFEEFRWELREGTPPTAAFEVEVRQNADDESPAKSGRLSEPRWRPTADTTSDWGDTVEWRVTMFVDQIVASRTEWVEARR